MGSLPRQFKSSAIMDLFARIANPELLGTLEGKSSGKRELLQNKMCCLGNSIFQFPDRSSSSCLKISESVDYAK
jgi:hypothetical protein